MLQALSDESHQTKPRESDQATFMGIKPEVGRASLGKHH